MQSALRQLFRQGQARLQRQQVAVHGVGGMLGSLLLALYEAKGWKPVVAPEVEFYLINPHADANAEVEPPEGRFINTPPMSMAHPYAAGALCSTVTDLVAWTRALAGVRARQRAARTVRRETS